MTFYILIGIPVFFVVLLTITARVEKRMVWPYGNPEPQPEFPDSSGYAAQWIGDAAKVGFSFFGWSSEVWHLLPASNGITSVGRPITTASVGIRTVSIDIRTVGLGTGF